jgi:flotillin
MGALFAIGVIGVVAAVTILLVLKNVLYVCQPNEVLIFSGRTRQTPQGEVGYRIVKGGRTFRVPLIEVVDRMDLTNMIIEVSVRGAYTKGGIPLSVQGVANIKVPGEEPLLHNTLQRFLGYSRHQIMEVARQTLEGNLRGVLATLTPEQVNQDKEAFAQRLTEEAEHDLNTIGLVLDTLKIQNVTDEVGYLNAIGRMRSAAVRRDAMIAEANAQAQAAEMKWQNTMNGEIAKLVAQIEIAKKRTERRILDARTRREALIAEQRAEVQAAIAQAQAEAQLQTARIEQVRLQLQAEVIQPAEAQRRQAEEAAKGAASRIVEQGRATAQVLARLAAQYRASGQAGRDVLLMQKLIPLLRALTEPLKDLHVDRLTVIGHGSGESDGAPLAAKLLGASEQIKAATGIDLPRVLREKLGQPGAPRGEVTHGGARAADEERAAAEAAARQEQALREALHAEALRRDAERKAAREAEMLRQAAQQGQRPPSQPSPSEQTLRPGFVVPRPSGTRTPPGGFSPPR